MNVLPWYKVILLFILFYSNSVLSQVNVKIEWSECIELPSSVRGTKHAGLAGAFCGALNNTLVLIGGANFPESMPWDGGKKKYCDEVYLLKLSDTPPFNWIEKKNKFPVSIAYGAGIVYHNKMICIGGENENGISDKVWELTLNAEEDGLLIKEITRLPVPLTNLTAACIGHKLYIAGGETKDQVSSKLYSLDLHRVTDGFTTLSDIPVAVSHTLLLPSGLKSNADLYLIGGRKKNTNGVSTLYSTVYRYHTKSNTWTEKAELPYTLSALVGIRIKKNQFLITGGDKGETFSKTEHYLSAIQSEPDLQKKQELINLKNQLLAHHPGFKGNLLYYDVKKDNWTIGERFSFEVPVTTMAVLWKKTIFLPSGEIRAGVRSPQIIQGKIKQK